MMMIFPLQRLLQGAVLLLLKTLLLLLQSTRMVLKALLQVVTMIFLKLLQELVLLRRALLLPVLLLDTRRVLHLATMTVLLVDTKMVLTIVKKLLLLVGTMIMVLLHQLDDLQSRPLEDAVDLRSWVTMQWTVTLILVHQIRRTANNNHWWSNCLEDPRERH